MIEKYSFDGYLKIIFGYLNDLNTYVDKSAPWDLRKTDQVKMKEVLDQISLCILKITQYLAPIIPNGAEKVYSTFGLDGSYLSFHKFDEIINKKSLKISKPEPNAFTNVSISFIAHILLQYFIIVTSRIPATR